MGQKDCTFSIIKKACPRPRFPCSRCGAKIVNAGLAWEISVPKYKKWYYMEPSTLAVNATATASPVVLNINRRLPFFSSETQDSAPCKFDGPLFIEAVNLTTGTEPGDYGEAFIDDFEYTRFTEVDAWNHFIRTHSAVVEWADAIVDPESGEATTPGHWRIGLVINQSAVYHYGIDDEHNNIFVQVALGAGYFRGAVTPDETSLDDVAITIQSYTPPDDYDCVIPPGEFSRWTRPMPTLPILIGQYTPSTVPPGYEVIGGSSSDNNAYPIGFRLGDYYAPPYIDVRHVPK